MLDIQLIEVEMTYSLRHQVLRPHQSIQECMYDTDHAEGASHVGAFDCRGKLVSIASFYIDNHPDFAAEKQYRLRGMATLEEFRGQGAGAAIVRYAEEKLQEQGFQLLWCMARTSAQGYYRKLGFETHGEVFDYPPIGPHIVMYKKLND